ncbi:MAG: hypothetical protein ACI88A_001780 [Paraglaciecola sp.]|jgi:hypothetical protein
MNKVNSNAHNYPFIRLGNGLLKLVLTKRTAENLIGDLEEAFNDRAETDLRVAKRWYVKQFVVTFISSIADRVKSDSSLNLSMLGMAVIILPVIFCMVAWLSNMDETTPTVWQLLLDGQLHQIVFFAEFWSVQPQALLAVEVPMFISYNSILWAALSLILIGKIAIRRNSSVRLVAGMGMATMLLPYLAGLAFIQIAEPIPTQVGPILAFMLLNVFYLLLPISFLVNKKYKQNNQYLAK